ncbi:MAG: hypothetical protein AAB316_02820 [Bacteroidota bacterium]
MSIVMVLESLPKLSPIISLTLSKTSSCAIMSKIFDAEQQEVLHKRPGTSKLGGLAQNQKQRSRNDEKFAC